MLQRTLFTATACVLLASGTSIAQQAPPSNANAGSLSAGAVIDGSTATSRSGGISPERDSRANGAVNTGKGESRTAAAPITGANSFTENEARHRIEIHGYSNVSELTKDDKGIWRGRALKDGQTIDVALDYQGNIVTDKP